MVVVCFDAGAGKEEAEEEGMEADAGKLFIGGISWDTNEDRLREYFDKYGEVVEAVIMRDRATGRARGFGFIVFADPAVAERVIMEKHMIDGRMVIKINFVCLHQHVCVKIHDDDDGVLDPSMVVCNGSL